MLKGTCIEPGCNRPWATRRLCAKHRMAYIAAGRELPPKITREETFWSKVERGDACWVWTGARNGAGYGSVMWDGRAGRGAHRVAYELLVGPIPEGMFLDHLCRTPACVNPDHLEPVTNLENVRRGLKGVLRTHCKNGHELAGRNIYHPPGTSSGRRVCRQCVSDAQARQRLRRRAIN